MELTIGIDDAGRGPLIGPMILAGVLIDKNQERFFENKGIKDSKLLAHSARIRLAKLIKDNTLDWKIVKATPEEIDNAIVSGFNLNRLEAMKMAELINQLNNNKDKIKVIVDCPSINIKKWQEMLEGYVKNASNLTIACEHKADFNYMVVGAASIVAKVEREEEVDKIKKQYGKTGSGYPSDPYTIRFLEEKGKELIDSGIFRKSWATWKNMFPEESSNEKGQMSLKEF